MDFGVLGYFVGFCWFHFLFLCSASSPLLTVCPWFWLWGTTFPSSFTMCFRLSQLVQSYLPTAVTGSDLNSSPTGANQWQQASTPELLTDLLRHRLSYTGQVLNGHEMDRGSLYGPENILSESTMRNKFFGEYLRPRSNPSWK